MHNKAKMNMIRYILTIAGVTREKKKDKHVMCRRTMLLHWRPSERGLGRLTHQRPFALHVFMLLFVSNITSDSTVLCSCKVFRRGPWNNPPPPRPCHLRLGDPQHVLPVTPWLSFRAPVSQVTSNSAASRTSEIDNVHLFCPCLDANSIGPLDQLK